MSVVDQATWMAAFAGDLQSQGWIATWTSVAASVNDVRTFGAVPGTICSAAIQAAIDALPVTGGAVYVPPGTWYATNLRLDGSSGGKSNVRLFGDGSASRIIKPAHSALTTDSDRRSSVIYAFGGHGHCVENLYVEGNMSRGGVTQPFCTRHQLGDDFASAGALLSVDAAGTSSSAVTSATDDVYIVTALGSGETSSAVNISVDVAAGFVTKVYDQSTGVGAFSYATGAGYANSWEVDAGFGYQHGIYMNGMTAQMVQPSVRGCEVTDAVYGGILLGSGPLFAEGEGFGTLMASIADNYGHDCGATIIGGGNKVKATITGNLVRNTDSSGIRADEFSHECVISNNVIDCNDIPDSNGGVNVYNSDRVTVSGNFITRTAIGISVNLGDNATVVGNTIYDVGVGISLATSNRSIACNNNIKETVSEGIKVTAGEYCQVAHNSFVDIGTDFVLDNGTGTMRGPNASDPSIYHNGKVIIAAGTNGTVYLSGPGGAENFQVAEGPGTIINRIVASGGADSDATSPALSTAGTGDNIDMRFLPKGTGKVRFGTHAGTADAPVSGYVEIKDAAGTVRKLAVIS